MKLVQFKLKNTNTQRVGIQNGQDILDLTAALGIKTTIEFLNISKDFQDTAAK